MKLTEKQIEPGVFDLSKIKIIDESMILFTFF